MALELVGPGLKVSYGAVQRREPRITTIKFDDGGYELRMKKGLNADLQIWDLTYGVLTIAEAQSMEDFLAAHGGVEWFWWRSPRSTISRKFVCKRWSREPISPRHDRLVLTLEQVADIV